MNERIKELLEQATIYAFDSRFVPGDNPRPVADVIQERFAELIVTECTAVLFDESERLSGLYSEEDNWQQAEEYEICSNQCINDIELIEKHFGVEK